MDVCPGNNSAWIDQVFFRPIIKRVRFAPLTFLVVCVALLKPGILPAEQIPVRYTEGLTHGFLALRTLAGSTIAYGDLLEFVSGGRVTHRLIFHFKDGSLHDETAVFSQHGSFRLLSDHLVQRGPSFPHPMEVSINCSTGQVTVHYNDDGKEKVETDRLELPPDVANGMVLPLLKNLRPNAPENRVSFVAATPKPRLVKLAISSQGEDPFSFAGSGRKAIHYIVKVEIGGITGALAPLLGKQPADTHVWVLGGEVPAFVKSEGPLYQGGPIWRIELVSPVWPRGPVANSTERKKGTSKR